MPNASVIRRAWGQARPTSGSAIDWSHPLADGLSVVGLFGEQTERHGSSPIAGDFWKNEGTPNVQVVDGLKGVGFLTDTTIATHSRAKNAGNVKILATDITFDGLIWVPAAGSAAKGAYVQWGDPNTNLNGNGYVLGVGSGTMDTDGTNFIGLNSDVAWLATTVPVKTGAWNHVAMTVTTAAAYKMYLNGVLVKSGTATPKITLATQTPALHVLWGSGNTGERNPNGGKIQTARKWDRILPEGHVAWLAAEPYAFFAPPGPRAIYYIGTTGVIAKTGTAYAALGAVMLDPGTKANTGATRALAGAVDLTTAKKGGLGATTAPAGAVGLDSGKKTAAGASIAPAGSFARDASVKAATGASRGLTGAAGTTAAAKGARGAASAALGAIGRTSAVKRITGAVSALLGVLGFAVKGAPTDFGCVDLTVTPTTLVDLTVTPTASIEITIEECP